MMIYNAQNLSHSQKEFLESLSIDVMARTLWGEARSEGQIGMEAVACVIVNRVKRAVDNGGNYWWGRDVLSVCQKPYQFSCWNKDDPNRKKLIAVTKADPKFVLALDIATRAIEGELNDITYNADHYHTKAIHPSWARGQKPVAVIGSHMFYNLNGKSV